jgi:hypothetical protein
MRNLPAIARDIRADWHKPYFGAVPYLLAMQSINTIDCQYDADSARTVVRYFLSNASAWRGDKARAIKTELKEML